MEYFIQRIEEVSKTDPHKPAICVDYQKNLVSYGQLWERSGKIYAYLKEKGISKEDMVLLYLPRGTEILIAMIGVWRAGAAFTVVENHYPRERVDYISKDCNCKLVIEENTYQEMLKHEGLEGFEALDKTAAAYAVYTSGTTGAPKGVLHEYGKFDYMMKPYERDDEYRTESINFALVAPLSFVASIMLLVPSLYFADFIYIVSYSIVKNPEKYKQFLLDEKINKTYMAPAMIRTYHDPSPYLIKLSTGSEPATGIYFEKPQICNHYSMSEAGFIVGKFILDKAYDTAPVGKCPAGIELKILDEYGRELPNGEIGEVCFQNPYTRGYINLEEQTKKVFINGLYHSGDLGYKDENDNLYISGRKDDMIKINGNRIEPQEIEAACKRVLGVRTAYAKGFDENHHAYVAVYYLKSEYKEKLSNDEINSVIDKLNLILPEYMVPSYFVALDEMPMLPNGKINRKALNAPRISEFKEEYEEPKGDIEKIICEAMEKVLKAEKVGRNDDFYMIGGDSLLSMELVSYLDTYEIYINTNDIYRLRTGKKIAAFYQSHSKADKETSSYKKQKELVQARNKKDYENYLKTGVIDSYYASWILQGNDLYNPSFQPLKKYILKERVDKERLLQAANEAAREYPYILFDIFLSENLPNVHFKDNKKPLVIHREGAQILFGSKENNGHFVIISYGENTISFRISHLLTDGFGMQKFVNAVLDAYFMKQDHNETVLRTELTDGFLTDLMKEDLPLSEMEREENKALFEKRDAFVLTDERVNSFEDVCTKRILLDKDKFQKFCDKYNTTIQIAAVLLLGQAIQKTNRSNEKPISVRMPVNTRTILAAKDSFQNASVPHIVLQVSPKCVDKNFLNDAASDLAKQFESHFSYAYLAEFTNRLIDALKSNDELHVASALDWYLGLSDVFVSYTGKYESHEWDELVEDMDNPCMPFYKLTLYVVEFKDKIIFEYGQSVANRAYIDNFMEILDNLE